MAKLVDQSSGEERHFVKSITLIGRAEYCDVCVRERIVSREHARILRRITGYYVEDLGSTHGTRVNSVRVHGRVKLHDGDVITIASVREDGSSTTPRPPHTDTSMPLRKTPPPGADTAAQGEVRIGASFVFHK